MSEKHEWHPGLCPRCGKPLDAETVQPRTIRDIVTDWLRTHGYDGLCRDLGDGEECGCSLDDFAPCGNAWDGPDWNRVNGCISAYQHADGLMYVEREGRHD